MERSTRGRKRCAVRYAFLAHLAVGVVLEDKLQLHGISLQNLVAHFPIASEALDEMLTPTHSKFTALVVFPGQSGEHEERGHDELVRDFKIRFKKQKVEKRLQKHTGPGNEPAMSLREDVEMRTAVGSGDVERGEEDDTVPRVAANRLDDLQTLLEGMVVQLPPVAAGNLHTDGADQEAASCMVCLDTMGTNSRITRLPCQHMLHHDCAMDWLHARIKQFLPGRCPACNSLVVVPKAPEPQPPEPVIKISRSFYAWLLCVLVGACIVMATTVAFSSNENSSWSLPKRDPKNGTRCSWSGNCVKIDPPADTSAARPVDGQRP